jgi:hypothetical protein
MHFNIILPSIARASNWYSSDTGDKNMKGSGAIATSAIYRLKESLRLRRYILYKFPLNFIYA